MLGVQLEVGPQEREVGRRSRPGSRPPDGADPEHREGALAGQLDDPIALLEAGGCGDIRVEFLDYGYGVSIRE